MGYSAYQEGLLYPVGSAKSLKSGEHKVISRAFRNVHLLAFSRLQQEAAILQATDVVGVRLEYNNTLEKDLGYLELNAIGTAIKPLNAPSLSTAPRLNVLSCADFRRLLHEGYQPVGIPVGACAWYQVESKKTMRAMHRHFFRTGRTSEELTDFTKGVSKARDLASHRMNMEARHMGADGVVGVEMKSEMEKRKVELDDSGRSRSDLVVNIFLLGTAIKKAEEVRKLDFGFAMDLSR